MRTCLILIVFKFGVFAVLRDFYCGLFCDKPLA